MAKKTMTTMRLSEEGLALLKALSKTYGVAQTAIVEMAVREKAKRERVTAPHPAPALAGVP